MHQPVCTKTQQHAMVLDMLINGCSKQVFNIPSFSVGLRQLPWPLLSLVTPTICFHIMFSGQGALTPLLTMEVTHPIGTYVSQGSERGRPEAASEILPQTFLQSNSGEQSETLTSFLMRKQTSCLIELGKPGARARGMAPRWKSMPN